MREMQQENCQLRETIAQRDDALQVANPPPLALRGDAAWATVQTDGVTVEVGTQTTQARVQALERELAVAVAAAAAAEEREHSRACRDGEGEMDPEVRRACDAMTLAVDHIALRTGCSPEAEAEAEAAAKKAEAAEAEAAAAEAAAEAAEARRLAAGTAWRRSAGVVGTMGAFRAAGVKAAAARAEEEAAAAAAKEAEEAAAKAAESRRLAAGATWRRTAGVVGAVGAFRAAGVKAAAARAEAEAVAAAKEAEEAAAAGRRSAWRRATGSIGVTRAFRAAGATRSAAEAEEEQAQEEVTCSEQLTHVFAHLHSAAAALGGADQAWVDPTAAAATAPPLHAPTPLEQLLRRQHGALGEPLSDVALVGALVAAAAGTAAVGDAAHHNNNKDQDSSGCRGRCSGCAQAVLQPRSAYLLQSTHTPAPAEPAAPAVRRPPPPSTWLGSGV